MSRGKCYIGIDNGCSGSVAIIASDGSYSFFSTPVKEVFNYQKVKKKIKRVDTVKLREILNDCDKDSRIVIERPLVNPKMFAATTSALRALEATLIVIEELGLAYEVEDSKTWQKEMLPKGCVGKELKEASLEVGNRLFPNVDSKHPDRDSLLMAEWLRLKYK